jgi:S1-C subfamily serine protease
MHVAELAIESASLGLFFDGQWRDLAVSVVGFNNQADVVVFAAQGILTAPGLPLRMRAGGPIVGQGVFFLGYPLGLHGHDIEPGFPTPVVKRGIVSHIPPELGGFYIEASANPGFSGAPVLCPDPGAAGAAAVVQAILIEELGYQTPVLNPDNQVVGHATTPSNLVKCVFIERGLELIRASPIGFPLPAQA